SVLALAACGGSRQSQTSTPQVASPPPVAALPAPPLPAGGPPPSPDGKTRIALLLPLSGQSKDIGNAMLEAAQLALFDLQKPDVILLPQDTGETPEGAIAAAQKALAEGAQIILGPLFSTSTTAVAPIARAAGVQVISFSNDTTVAQPGVYVMGFTVQPQVERVVSYAASQNLTSMAVLAPSSPYGQSVVATMEETARNRGATVQPVGFFDPQGADLNASVTGFAASAKGVQAVMVPVGGARLSQVVPLMAYRDLDPRQTKYLGTGLWDTANTWREGALLGAWYAAPPPETRTDFEKRFNETYGRAPPRLASLAYDATALAGLIGTKAPNGSLLTAQTLSDPNGFAGVDGIFRWGPDGLPQRGLAVIEIQRNGVRTISPAPASFQQQTTMVTR
ncbi:MAG: putative ABC-type branched-chain amino acid binding protein, partial [Alphaproteobacteria bacterium]|nr:putative ABC-type branched-chain amino acid binding protein [Alphaproteobacteria bacterium]